MYPIQNFQNYPNQVQGYDPYLQPQVNAVKIDINHPKAYGGVNSQGQLNPPIPAPNYTCPCGYPYNMPQVPQYMTTGAYPIPPIQTTMPTTTPLPAAPVGPMTQAIPTAPAVPMTPAIPTAPAVPMTPAVPTTTQPIQTVNNIQQNQAQATTPVINANPQNTVATPVTPIPVPVVPVAPIPVVPAVPPQSVIPQPPVVNAPVTQTVNVNPTTGAVDAKQTPVTNQTQTTTQTPATNQTPVEAVKPVEAQPQNAGLDVNGILTALSSTNADDQTAAIQKIAEVAQTNPVVAKALLNEQVFGQLVNIINADTSKLQGPANGKPDAKNLSPLEKAEINKQFAVYTLAILQKNFREEINKEMKKNNLPDIAINDVPYIKEGIVNNLKDNPNPTIREACLSALNYLGRPEDKEVLKTLYDISAKHDPSPAVKTAAQDYLTKVTA